MKLVSLSALSQAVTTSRQQIAAIVISIRDEALKIHKKCFEGYHKQKLPSSRFYDVVSYIKYHDEGMLKRLGDKRSRIDIILDRIREQDAENMA